MKSIYFIVYKSDILISKYNLLSRHTKAPWNKPPEKSPPLGQKVPHNEIIIQSYYIFFYIDGDIEDILNV